MAALLPNSPPCLGDAVRQMALWQGVAAGQEQAVHSKNVGHPVTLSPGTAKSGGSPRQLRSRRKSTWAPAAQPWMCHTLGQTSLRWRYFYNV